MGVGMGGSSRMVGGNGDGEDGGGRWRKGRDGRDAVVGLGIDLGLGREGVNGAGARMDAMEVDEARGTCHHHPDLPAFSFLELIRVRGYSHTDIVYSHRLAVPAGRRSTFSQSARLA